VAFLLEVRSRGGKKLAGFAILAQSYQFPDGSPVTLRADVAWCRPCRRFTLAEHFVTRAEIEHEVSEFFRVMFARGEDTQFLRDALRQRTQRTVAERQPWFDYRPHRCSPPRCLECGGTDFVCFEDWDEWYDHPERPEQFRVLCTGHADVGGRTLFDPEGIRIGAYRLRADL